MLKSNKIKIFFMISIVSLSLESAQSFKWTSRFAATSQFIGTVGILGTLKLIADKKEIRYHQEQKLMVHMSDTLS